MCVVFVFILLPEAAIWVTSYHVSYCLLRAVVSSDFSSEKCSECGMEGGPRQEFVQGWTQGQGTYMTVSTHATFKLLIVSMLYLHSFYYDRLIYDVKFLEMVATTILITCLYLVSLCVHTCTMAVGWRTA